MARTSLMTSIFFSPAAAEDREFGLFLGRGSGGAGGRTGHRDGGGGGHAPLLFEKLREFGSFEHREARQVVNNFLQISH